MKTSWPSEETIGTICIFRTARIRTSGCRKRPEKKFGTFERCGNKDHGACSWTRGAYRCRAIGAAWSYLELAHRCKDRDAHRVEMEAVCRRSGKQKRKTARESFLKQEHATSVAEYELDFDTFGAHHEPDFIDM